VNQQARYVAEDLLRQATVNVQVTDVEAPLGTAAVAAAVATAKATIAIATLLVEIACDLDEVMYKLSHK